MFLWKKVLQENRVNRPSERIRIVTVVLLACLIFSPATNAEEITDVPRQRKWERVEKKVKVEVAGMRGSA